MTLVWLSDWSRELTSQFTRTLNYNLQCLNFKLIAGDILRYFSNRSAFDDKLNVSCPAGVGNYLICMNCFETNTCVFFGHGVEFY